MLSPWGVAPHVWKVEDFEGLLDGALSQSLWARRKSRSRNNRDKNKNGSGNKQNNTGTDHKT